MLGLRTRPTGIRLPARIVPAATSTHLWTGETVHVDIKGLAGAGTEETTVSTGPSRRSKLRQAKKLAERRPRDRDQVRG